MAYEQTVQHVWSTLQLRFSSPECKTLCQQTTGLTSVLPQAKDA